MKNNSYVKNSTQSRFYLITVDILKGLAIFPMIFGHAVGWWDSYLASHYDTGSLAIIIIMATGILVFPCFLYFSGFNQVNSILKIKTDNARKREIRSHTINRALIFFVLASISMLLMSFVQSKAYLEDIISYLLTWHLFHMFAFSTLFIFCLYECAWLIKERFKSKWSIKDNLIILLLISLIVVISLFLFFHDYTLRSSRPFPVPLDIQLIMENIFLDVSSCGVIPWLSFPLAGALTASFLDLPNHIHKNLSKRVIIVLVVNFLLLVLGIIFLRFEKFVSAGIGYPSSIPHVFISIGLLGLLNIILLIILDLYEVIPTDKTKKFSFPIVSLSKISLTVYFVHPIFAILNPKIISSESILILIVAFYCLFFIILALIWQRWDYKYSLEWFITRFS